MEGEDFDHEWQAVALGARRMRVPTGGWIYETDKGVAFVPDPENQRALLDDIAQLVADVVKDLTRKS